jgi:hypothetical protein
MLVGLDGAVIGSALAIFREPMLPAMWLPNTFHCTPRSRPIVRDASMKRTSSMTCCACMICIELITVLSEGTNWRAVTMARSSVSAFGTGPDSMICPLTDDTWMFELVTRRSSAERRPTS